MRPQILVKEIRQLEIGFIVEACWPYGREPGDYGSVICLTFKEVVNLLLKCASEEGESGKTVTQYKDANAEGWQ